MENGCNFNRGLCWTEEKLHLKTQLPVGAAPFAGNSPGKIKFIAIIGILENAGDARGRMAKFVEL